MPSLLVPDHVKRARLAQGPVSNIKTMRGEFERAAFTGNQSGRIPVGDKVMILPDAAVEKTAGQVLIPDEYRERSALAAESGVLIAVGEDAFMWNSDRTRKWEGDKPKAGDRVYFARYQYTEVMGDDGVKYWVMNDNSIGAIDKRQD
jgi:co-chaperonin GroES (HSP10)